MQSDKSGVVEQRNILFSEFLDARSLEISNMDRILTEKMFSTTKLAFQLLPKHMRRRPMSHNKYRIPSRIRGKTSENSLKKPIKCRKHLRKSKILALRYQQRGNKTKWLESHLFQAKRMKMVEYFGYKIALHPNSKSERACYRFFKHDAVMYDLSYHVIIEFQEMEDVLKNYFGHFLVASDLTKIFQDDSQKGLKSGKVLFWKDKEKGDLIGPVEYFFQPLENEESLQKNLWLLVHPGLKEDFSKLFKDNMELKPKFIENSMNIFHIFGPKSLGRILEVLNKMGLEEIQIDNLVKCFKIVTDPGTYPKGAVLHLSFEKKLENKKYVSEKKDFALSKIHKIEAYDKPVSLEINKAIEEIISYETGEKKNIIPKEKTIWNIPDFSNYLKRFRTIVRGRYTHKKQNKQANISKSTKLSRKEKKKQKLANKIEKKLKQTLIRQNPSPLRIEIEEDVVKSGQNANDGPLPFENPLMNIMISFDSHLQSGGVKIFVPLGSGLCFWRLLHYANIKILGLREYENILHENKNLVFPLDYPLTETHKTFTENHKNELIQKYFRRPPKNRLNYQRVGFPFPFKSDFSILGNVFKDLQPIQIRAIFKGTPKERAMICLLKKEDLEMANQMLKNRKDDSGIVHREKLKPKVLGNLKKLTESKLEVELKKIITERDIIGFVSSGDFSRTERGGAGIGFIKKGLVSKENNILALFRNPNSRYYYLCELNFLIQ